MRLEKKKLKNKGLKMRERIKSSHKVSPKRKTFKKNSKIYFKNYKRKEFQKKKGKQ